MSLLDSESEISSWATGRFQTEVLVCHNDFWPSRTSSLIPGINWPLVLNDEVEFLCQGMRGLKPKGSRKQTGVNTLTVLHWNQEIPVAISSEIILAANHMNAYCLTACPWPVPSPQHPRCSLPWISHGRPAEFGGQTDLPLRVCVVVETKPRLALVCELDG